MIRKWGEETAKKFNIKTEEDVDRIIHEFREEADRRLLTVNRGPS
ncbi:MAG: hypothetical protein QME81_02755 [bacterium]|nr:hypothetical protein [bacterium]